MHVSSVMIKKIPNTFVPLAKVPYVKTFYDHCDLENKVKVKIE